MSTCECCGHAVNGHQEHTGSHVLCSLCEDVLNGIATLPPKTLQHVLARGTGARAGDVARALGCANNTHSGAVTGAAQHLKCSMERLMLVTAFGQSLRLLNVPKGFDRPTHQPPTFDAPKPKVLERVVIEAPAPRPVIVEHREPEAKEPVRMLTDRAEDAPLPRAVEAVNQEEEEEPVPQTIHGSMTVEVDREAARHLLPNVREQAEKAALAYQEAFAGLAHLALTGEGLPDLSLVRLGFEFGRAKGAVEALEALA